MRVFGYVALWVGMIGLSIAILQLARESLLLGIVAALAYLGAIHFARLRAGYRNGIFDA